MDELSGRVAVVTGAASGIGRALAARLAGEGAKVVLADVERAPLDEAVGELAGRGHDVRGVETDVSAPADLDRLAARALESYGAIHIVCNNAGVALGGDPTEPIWDISSTDWEWLLGVNLLGVVNGLRTFMPILIEQGVEAHVLNTASVTALLPGGGPYGASKRAIVAITESLDRDVQRRSLPIGVSVLCPGLVPTRLPQAERNRPARLRDEARQQQERGTRAAAARATETLSAERVAELAVELGIKRRQLHVLTHHSRTDDIRRYTEGVLGA